jgi:phosphate-selective porin OprO/OprP
VSDALLPSRNKGIVLNGATAGQRMTYAVGLFDDGANQFVGRLTALPFVSKERGSLLHIGFGLRHTEADRGLRFRTEPEFNNAPLFVDTGLFEADHATLYDVEISARRGPLWLAGEYLKTDVSAPAQGDPDFSGYHFTASWIVTGEMRKYNRRSATMGPVPISKPVNRGGVGAWELAARWSDLDLSDRAIEGGEMRILSFGVNWWLTPWSAFSMNYRDIRLDRFDTVGRSDGLLLRLLLMLE